MKLIEWQNIHAVRAWATLTQTEDWKPIRQDLERALRDAYRDATARIDTEQRCWMAGRAAMLQELLDTLDKIAREHSGRRMPPVTIVG